MKKSLLFLLTALSGSWVTAQDFTITGTVTDANANPVVNHAIYISSDSGILNYSNTVYTDVSGNYSDVIINGAQVGPNINYYIYTNDYCSPNGGWQTATLSNNQGTVTSGVADFMICDSTSNTFNCMASFYGVDTANNGNYYFIDMSYGTGLTYSWDFGDGNTSTLQNPSNAFANGTYTVCLTITGSSCSDTYCQTITIGGPACNASFYSYVDTTNSTVYLIDLSNQNNPNSVMSYLWDFGDGNTSNLQYPSHTYANYGNYLVCLTITATLCTSTFCDSIGISQFMSEESRSGFSLNVMAPATLGADELENTIIGLNVYPNPANEIINLEYHSLSAGNHFISLTDVTGKIIYNENFSAQKGNNRKQIDLNGVEAGIYFVGITDSNGQINHLRLIKE